jgi:UDP-N-acetylglucosamine acyltransferase
MARIHPLACIDPAAEIADDAEIGPFCVVGPGVTIAGGCRLIAHVHVEGETTLGANTVVHAFAALGGAPQSVSYRGEPTRLTIGGHCVIREGVTMSRGSKAGGGLTAVGERGFFMSNSHVAHDCRVGNDVVFASTATLGGHCEIGDHVFIGGVTALHQFVRVGPYAIIGGMTGVRGDVIPFGLAEGMPARLSGVNIVGMKRNKFAAETIANIRRAYRRLFLGAGAMVDRLAEVETELGQDAAVAQVLDFIRARDKRPLCRAAAGAQV